MFIIRFITRLGSVTCLVGDLHREMEEQAVLPFCLGIKVCVWLELLLCSVSGTQGRFIRRGYPALRWWLVFLDH